MVAKAAKKKSGFGVLGVAAPEALIFLRLTALGRLLLHWLG
jgi:hypothetical protein